MVVASLVELVPLDAVQVPSIIDGSHFSAARFVVVSEFWLSLWQLWQWKAGRVLSPTAPRIVEPPIRPVVAAVEERVVPETPEALAAAMPREVVVLDASVPHEPHNHGALTPEASDADDEFRGLPLERPFHLVSVEPVLAPRARAVDERVFQDDDE